MLALGVYVKNFQRRLFLISLASRAFLDRLIPLLCIFLKNTWRQTSRLPDTLDSSDTHVFAYLTSSIVLLRKPQDRQFSRNICHSLVRISTLILDMLTHHCYQ